MSDTTAMPGEEPPAAPRQPPQPPAAPEPADCCGGGCLHCVYDLYDQAMERYQTELAEWQGQ